MKRDILVCMTGLGIGLSLIKSGLAQSEPEAPSSYPLSAEVRQKIYRVPMLDGTTLLTADTQDDAVIARQLESWLDSGEAAVISDLATSINAGDPATLTEGRNIWLPSERDQDFDRLFLMQTASLPSFVGTALTTRMHDQNSRSPIDWNTTYVEKAPLLVRWPASWLEQKKAIHGWMDWYDTFKQTLQASSEMVDGGPTVVGAFPSALHVWNDQATGPESQQMDIVIAEVTSSAKVEQSSASTNQRMVFTGVVIPSQQALSLLEKHTAGENDNELYATLLEQAKNGKAQLRFCSASSYKDSSRLMSISGRNHAYPTEMPSIPSAWDNRLVGTYIESDTSVSFSANLSIEHHVAPPRRQTWSLATGEPELLMWEPAFRCLQLNSTATLAPEGTRLLTMMKVPSVMLGEGLNEEGSLFIFAHASGAKPKPLRKNANGDPFATEAIVEASKESGEEIETIPLKPNIYLQLHVFEVPASEQKNWDNSSPETHAKKLSEVIKNTHTGTAKLVGHGMIATLSGSRSTVFMVELVNNATEYDPPSESAPHRARPTALNDLPTGTSIVVDTALEKTADGTTEQIKLSYLIAHSTKYPEEPSLEHVIKTIGISGSQPVPEAKQYAAEWFAGTILNSGEPICLGARPDPASHGKEILVAFLTARVEKR